MSTVPDHSATGDLTWEVARLFPSQGDWSEEEYLSLTDWSNQLIEFTDGVVEFLPVPTLAHQRLLMHILLALSKYCSTTKRGEVLPPGTRVYIRSGKYREPDIVFKLAEKIASSGNRYWKGADLIVEIVSDDDKSIERDYDKKVLDYAEGGISEYWIVDPQKQLIKVLALNGDKYVEHAVANGAGHVASRLLEGFSVDAAAVWAAGRGEF